MQTALAWTLHVPLARVKTALRHPGVNFLGPHLPTIDGAAAAILLRPAQIQTVSESGIWRVQRVLAATGAPEECVGS